MKRLLQRLLSIRRRRREAFDTRAVTALMVSVVPDPPDPACRFRELPDEAAEEFMQLRRAVSQDLVRRVNAEIMDGEEPTP
jgi:hypothetical protein